MSLTHPGPPEIPVLCQLLPLRLQPHTGRGKGLLPPVPRDSLSDVS